ncbi:transglycosylase family protein [Streptomyces sp. CRN 30]|uniref:transglycosylase family protein n=1 Tax=Streptomyces sp. CRN 30 TaxID=3075613 RepID=UPI002A817EF8|nr:transglycosylase family protein [Streptomyces sp. CRN 30]
MLSGNGRHRRPRQAPALLVAAGVTGSAIAIPLLGASGASAADGTVWDQVADCESGGSWSANTGNGHYGGLQMSQSDWEKYGGLDYAPRADQASRSQQIAVAESMLADRGAIAWATCGVLAGLAGDDDAADTDTSAKGGSTKSSGSSGSSASSGASGSSESATPAAGTTTPGSGSTGSASPSAGTADETASGDKSGASGASTSEEDDPKASASGDESGEPGGDEDAAGETEEGLATDAASASPSESAAPSADASTDAAEGTGRHRGDSAAEQPAAGVTGGSTASTGRHAAQPVDVVSELTGGAYTLRSGDGLWAGGSSL